MCNFDRISGFLIGAQVAYIATLAMLAVATINAASVFAVAANVPLMVAAILLTATATGLLVAARAELDNCLGGSCNNELQSLRADITRLLIAISAFALLLIGIAVVAAIPFVGSIATISLLANAITLTAGFSALVSYSISKTITSFNACQSRNNASSNNSATGIVFALAYFTIGLVLIWAVAGYVSGVIPTHLEWG